MTKLLGLKWLPEVGDSVVWSRPGQRAPQSAVLECAREDTFQFAIGRDSWRRFSVKGEVGSIDIEDEQYLEEFLAEIRRMTTTPQLELL